jgi:hypothetical protein
MATVTSYDQAQIDEIVGALVTTGAIDDDGNLTVTTQSGTVIAVGTVLQSVPTATESISGTVMVATAAEVTAGTDDTSAVTPLKLETVTTAINTAIAAKQASSAVLTTIAGLSPANKDVLQYESTAWSHRTPAQLAADLVAAYQFLAAQLYSGSAYAAAVGAQSYVGATDPSTLGTVVNGSIWFDTSGS